jgi:hypothetical protein
MPKILESEALTIARSIDQAPETDRPWMLDLLDRYQQQQRDDGEPDWPSVERARVERETNLRGMFESPDKITYDPGPFSQNPQEAKMLHANMALLSARYQKEPREVAERYDFLINDFARQKFGASEDVDTAKFYALAQKDMQRIKLLEDTQREGVNAALRGEDGVKALAAWQAKNADRAKEDAGLFMRGYQQALEQDGEMLPIADRLLPLLEAQSTKKYGQAFDQTKAQELGGMIEQLAGMKKAQRKSVYRSIAARIEAAGYDQKGFWSQMLGFLDQQLYAAASSVGETGGIAVDASIALAQASGRSVDMLDGTPIATPVLSPEQQQALMRQRDYRERIGDVEGEIIQIVSGELDPVKPTTGWMNETIETGLIKAPGAILPSMGASALLGPYGAGLLFTADFASNTRRELVQSGLDADQARKVGVMAAPLQAAVESLSNMVSLGKFPAVQSVLSRFTRPVGGASLVGRYVQNSLISGATEFTEEQVQDNVVVPAMQELLGALEKDVPDVDWSFYKTRAANATPELAVTLLPMALVFGGVMTAADARLSDRMTSNVDALTALNYSQAQATEIVQEKTPEARIAKAASLWRSREGNKTSLEQGATKLAERLKALSSDAVAYQAELERRGVLPRVMHTAENDWLLTFNDGSTARFATHDEASTARWTWAEDQLGRVHALTREALTSMERNMSTNRELGVEFKPDVRMVEAGQTTPDIQRRVEQGKVLGDIDPNEAFDTASMVDRATAEADGFLSSYQILGSSRNEFKDGVLRTTIKLWEGSNVLTLVEEKLEGDAKAIVSSRGGRGWMLAALRNYEQESGDKLFREVPDNQLTDDDLVEAWSHLGQSYLVGRSSFGEPLQQNNMRRFSRLLMRAGLAGALNSESTFWQAVVNRAQKLGELKAAGKLNEDVVAELEKQLGIDSQVKHEQGAMQEVQQVRDEVAQQVDTSGYSEATPGPNGETFSIAPSLLSVKPPRGVVANTTDALPSWTLPKISGSVSKVLNSPKVRAEFYGKLDKAIEWLRADPLQITTAKGWVTFMRKAGVWGDIPMPPSGLADIIANPAAYVAKLNGGYHGAASLSDTQTSAKQGMDGTVEMRKLIGDGKAPAPFVVALHNMWGILSRMLSPIDQEGMWLRLIAHRPVLDAIQSSIDGTFAMTVDQWKQVVQDARASSAVESGPIGNAATSNANDFYLMLSRLNGRWNDMADVYAAPNSREMGRRFWNIGAGKLGIKNKVQRFIGLTFGTPGVIMDRWKFVEFWLPTAMEGMQANEPSSYFNYSANTPSDPVGVYGVYGGIDSDNEALSLAMYEAFEVVLEESIAKSEELQFHLGEHANAGGMHWFGWNAIKNEAVGHSSLDLTKELIATFGLDIDAEKVHTTVTNGTYYTEGSPSAGNTVKFVLERGKVRVERTTLAGGFQSGQAGRNAKAAGRGIAEGRTGTSGAIGDTFSIRKPTKKQLDKILPNAKYIAPDELMDAEIRGPVVIGAYHGTTHTIEQFTDERAYLENDMGAGVYASTSIEDVNANYAGEGPDLTQRIELTKEQLVNDGMDEDEAEREARSMLKGHGGAVIPLLIPMRNPVVLWKGRVGDSTNRGTFIEFRGDVEQYRDEAEELVMDREGITRDELPDYQDQVQDAMYEIEAEKDFDGVLAKIARVVDSFDDTDSGAFVSSLDQDGMYAADLEQELRNNEGTVYATSGDNGQLAVGELIRRVFMDALGFDGIIDKNVNTKFGSRSRGKAMAGMDDNTAHVIVATDTELRPRSAFNTDTTFSLRVTPAQDAEYLAAVEAGDSGSDNLNQLLRDASPDERQAVVDSWIKRNPKAAARMQRMVNDAAKKAGYSVGTFIHRTDSDFNSFLKSKGWTWFNTDESLDEDFQFTYGDRRIDAYLDLSRKYTFDEDFQPWESAYQRNAELASLENKGITSIQMPSGDVAVANPSQIKSADPVTYDDAGNVIPLSKRFNPADDRITYSLRPGDFASRVEAMFSPFQRSPEARLVMARVAKDRALRVMPQLLELQAQFDNNEKQRQDLETKFAEESAQLRADLEANEKQIRQDRDFEIKGVAQDKGSELDRERIRRDADNKLASLRLEYERNIRELEKRKESETAKLSRKDTSAQREKTRQLLRVLDGILAASPPEVRARVGGFVKMAGIATDEAALRYLEDRVAKLDKELEKWLKKDAAGSINRLFKKAAADYTAGKKAKGKLGPDEHYLFQRAEAATTMDAAALRGELAKLDALSVDDSLSDDQRVLAVLERGIVELVGDMKNADSGRLFTAFDELTRLYSQGVVAWKAKQTARREARQAVRDALKADAGKSGVLKERQAMEKAMTTLFGKAKSAWLSVSSFSEVLRYAFGSKSQQATELIDGEREASNDYEDEQQAIADELETLFTSMAGGKVLDGERLRFDMAQRTIKAGDVELSQFEAITALLMWRQEDGRRHMEGTFDENGQRTSGWSYDQAWIDEVEKQLTPEGRSFMAWLAAKYGSEHGELNALYRERHGVNLPAHDNYAPLTVKPMQAKAGEIVDPVSGAAVSGSILTPGSLRTRSRMAIAEPEFRDALQTFVAHKKQMGYWKAYYDLATDVQAVLGNRELMNSVEAAAGKEAVVTLRKWMDVLAQGGVRDAAAGLAMNGMFQRMMNRAATVGLLGRVSTLLVQSTQLAAASVQMPVGAYLRRFGKLLAGQLDWKGAIQSDFIQRRIQSAPPIVRQAMENLGTATRPNLIKQAVRKLGNLLTGADGLFTGGTYAILLDYHRETGRKLGLTGTDLEEHAHREAERATEEVAQPTRTATRSLAEITATNPLAKVSFAYASEARQKIALLGWAAVNFKADPVRFGKAAFLVFGVGGVMSQVLKNIWKEAKGDDDEEKWSPERLVRGSVANALHGIPMMSEIMGEPGMFSSTAWAQASLDDLLKGEADLRDINTLLGTLGLFNDTAAGVAAMSNAGYDFAKIIEAAFSE